MNSLRWRERERRRENSRSDNTAKLPLSPGLCCTVLFVAGEHSAQGSLVMQLCSSCVLQAYWKGAQHSIDKSELLELVNLHTGSSVWHKFPVLV